MSPGLPIFSTTFVNIFPAQNCFPTKRLLTSQACQKRNAHPAVPCPFSACLRLEFSVAALNPDQTLSGKIRARTWTVIWATTTCGDHPRGGVVCTTTRAVPHGHGVRTGCFPHLLGIEETIGATIGTATSCPSLSPMAVGRLVAVHRGGCTHIGCTGTGAVCNAIRGTHVENTMCPVR